MLTKNLLLKLFEGAYIQRWNDKLRPIDFIEADKHGHKMAIAYFFAKCEERKNPIDWDALIEGGIFEYLQKLVLTDLKSPVFYKIKSDSGKYRQLNAYVFTEIAPTIAPLGNGFYKRFKEYFQPGEQTREQRILGAASTFASRWEFDIIHHADPHGFENEDIKKELLKRIDSYGDLLGVREVRANPSAQSFINLCGQLRFQTRWADLHRIPKTSVLSHCFLVAMFAFLLTRHINGCARRNYNNYFGGLFHDFPEVLTRDIITPIKRAVDGLRSFLIEYEKEEMEKIVYPLLPQDFHADMRTFTELDHRNRIINERREMFLTIDEITAKYNDDRFSPCDGELIKVADELSAFLESYEAQKNGCVSPRYGEAQQVFSKKYRDKIFGGLSFRDLLEEFFPSV